jgi:hypothetical protein
LIPLYMYHRMGHSIMHRRKKISPINMERYLRNVPKDRNLLRMHLRYTYVPLRDVYLVCLGIRYCDALHGKGIGIWKRRHG